MNFYPEKEEKKQAVVDSLINSKENEVDEENLTKQDYADLLSGGELQFNDDDYSSSSVLSQIRPSSAISTQKSSTDEELEINDEEQAPAPALNDSMNENQISSSEDSSGSQLYENGAVRLDEKLMEQKKPLTDKQKMCDGVQIQQPAMPTEASLASLDEDGGSQGRQSDRLCLYPKNPYPDLAVATDGHKHGLLINVDIEHKVETFKEKTKATGQAAKEYIAETGSKMKDSVVEFGVKSKIELKKAGDRLKSYIGSKHDAPTHDQDNEYIIRGYRINHNTCSRLFRSLFSCHNESVNVWSHMCGAFFFLGLLLILFFFTVPTQFEYGRELIYTFTAVQKTPSAYPTFSPYEDSYISSLLVELEGFVDDVSQTDLTQQKSDNVQSDFYDAKTKEFQNDIEQIYSRTEGVSYFVLSELFDFQYLSKNITEDPSKFTSNKDVIDTWHSTIDQLCSRVQAVLTTTFDKIDETNSIEGLDPLPQYLLDRLRFIQRQLKKYAEELTELKELLVSSVNEDTSQDAAEKRTAYLTGLVKSEAPTFKDANHILNYITTIPLIINILSACFCLGCSAAFHLLYVKSEQVAKILSRLDYGGISVLILGSTMPILFYTFPCEQAFMKRNIFLGFMTVGCVGAFTASLLPKFDQPAFRPVRATMFVTLSLSTVAIFVSLAWKNPGQLEYSALYYALGGAIYIGGAILYVLRIPERCKPGAFDICGASHQIFHFAVLTGCVMHYAKNYVVFKQRQVFECPIWIH